MATLGRRVSKLAKATLRLSAHLIVCSANFWSFATTHGDGAVGRTSQPNRPRERAARARYTGDDEPRGKLTRIVVPRPISL